MFKVDSVLEACRWLAGIFIELDKRKLHGYEIVKMNMTGYIFISEMLYGVLFAHDFYIYRDHEARSSVPLPGF